MTAVIVWRNRETWFEGLWAVADRRISGRFGTLTDQYPKLSVIHALGHRHGDSAFGPPAHLFSIALAFAGNTLIASAVWQMLSTALSNLQEIHYYDAPSMPLRDKLPRLEEVAQLAAAFATGYVANLGELYPDSARTEIALFGRCPSTQDLQLFRLANGPTHPAEVNSLRVDLAGDEVLVMGDASDIVRADLAFARADANPGSLAWNRAPIRTLLGMIKHDSSPTVGGGVDVVAAGHFGTRQFFMHRERKSVIEWLGTDLFGLSPLGGFTFWPGIGLNDAELPGSTASAGDP